MKTVNLVRLNDPVKVVTQFLYVSMTNRDTQRDTKTDKQIDKQTPQQTDKTNRHPNRQTNRQTNKQIDKQVEKQTDKHTHTKKKRALEIFLHGFNISIISNKKSHQTAKNLQDVTKPTKTTDKESTRSSVSVQPFLDSSTNNEIQQPRISNKLHFLVTINCY